MSKETALDLIKLGDDYLIEYFNNVDLEEFRNMLRIALKEQDRDTRHACAEEINYLNKWDSMKTARGEEMMVSVLRDKAHDAVMNCRGGLPEGL